jgi:SAM-dependent methyltransferase
VDVDDFASFNALRMMIVGYEVSRAIYVAAKLGIADQLANGPLSAEDLARETGAHPPSLYRLLRALAGAGVFVEGEDRRFALTPISNRLRSDVVGSQRAYALMHHEEQLLAWVDVLETIRTGETAFDRVHGMSLFGYYRQHPDAGARFDAAQRGRTTQVAAAAVATYDFSSCRRILDVGGGLGTLLVAILQRYPAATGILFDAPHVVETAKGVITGEGLAERCEILGGDFFEAVPGGADTLILSDIVHDWDDEPARRILANCRRAIDPSGRLLLLEAVLAERNPPLASTLTDLHMLMVTGGRERTEEELRSLLDPSGFHLARVIPTSSPRSIVEAFPN